MQILKWYLELERQYSLGTHLSVFGFVITIIGFGVSLWKLALLSRQTQCLQHQIDRSLNRAGGIESVAALSIIVERIKHVRAEITSGDTGRAAKTIQDVRSDLITRRSAIERCVKLERKILQGLITRLSKLEDLLLSHSINDVILPPDGRTKLLSSHRDCLDKICEILDHYKSTIIREDGRRETQDRN